MSLEDDHALESCQRVDKLVDFNHYAHVICIIIVFFQSYVCEQGFLQCSQLVELRITPRHLQLAIVAMAVA